MKLGGPKALTDEVKRLGGDVGPRTFWVTPGVEGWGWGGFDQFLAACKVDGVQPLVMLWFWGDSIAPNVFATGVADKYQKDASGKPIFVTLAKCHDWALEIARRSREAGLSPIVVIEPEFSKNGVTESPNGFVSYFTYTAATLQNDNPGIRTVFCPGIWSNMNTVATNFASCIARADIIGLQTVLFRPRHSEAEFTMAGSKLQTSFDFLRQGAPGKPCAIVDLCFSSYGGYYNRTHPFAGGNGMSGETLQAAAIKGIAKVTGLEFICYRALGDDPNFDIANYGGWGERYVGVVHLGGMKKSAYEALMAIARPIVKMFTQAEYDAVVLQRDLASLERNNFEVVNKQLIERQATLEALVVRVEAYRKAHHELLNGA